MRLRRNPRLRQAVILGVVLGASLLTDQQSAVLVAILVAAVLLPWLLTRRAPDGAAGNGTGGVARPAAEVTATAMAGWRSRWWWPARRSSRWRRRRARAARAFSLQSVAKYYTTSSSYLPGLFLPSPRVVGLGLTS